MSAEHDQLESSLAAFLLGATDAEEAELVRAHLEGCASCQELAKRLERSIAALPLAVDATPPPARLRERILAEAAASRRPSVERPQRTQVLRLPRPAPRSGWRVGLRTAVAAAAIIAFALGAGIGLGVGRSLAPQPQPAPTVAQFSMTGSGSMSSAHGSVYELKSEGLTLIQFSGLPQPGQGHVYELWLIPSHGQPAPAGVFTPDPDGSRFVVVARSLQGFNQVAVTEEVGPNGVSAPTQQPQLGGVVG